MNVRSRLVVNSMRNDDATLRNYPYSGPLASLYEQFILKKRALGYQYNTESWYLSQFSKFTESFDCPDEALPQEIVQAWIVQKTMESDKSRYTRYSVVSQFARYMERMGYSAYIPGRDEIGKLHKTFMPYIFSHKEIRSFFVAADAMTLLPHSVSPRKHRIMPVLFRLLYCCGLRVSEATKLLGEDVDLEHGILTIRNSKFEKTRYVPMSTETTAACANYAKTRLIGPPGVTGSLHPQMVDITAQNRFMTYFVSSCGKREFHMVDAGKDLVSMIFAIHFASIACKGGQRGAMISPLCCLG